jgi:hypothetical protein
MDSDKKMFGVISLIIGMIVIFFGAKGLIGYIAIPISIISGIISLLTEKGNKDAKIAAIVGIIGAVIAFFSPPLFKWF